MAVISLPSNIIEIINGSTNDAVDVSACLLALLNSLNSVSTGSDILVPTITANQLLGTAVVDEDNMASDSAVRVPTQQSVKAYVDNLFATISNMDSIGTVQIVEANGNISTSFTKTANDRFLRFNFSGAVIGNTTGQVQLYIGGNLKRTVTTQGPPMSWSASGGFAQTAVLSAGASSNGLTAPVAIGTQPFGGGATSAAYVSTTGSTGASPIQASDEFFDITGEANGLLAIQVTFTNVTNGSAAIYKNA